MRKLNGISNTLEEKGGNETIWIGSIIDLKITTCNLRNKCRILYLGNKTQMHGNRNSDTWLGNNSCEKYLEIVGCKINANQQYDLSPKLAIIIFID